MTGLPRLYGELSPWFHLLTAPDEYADEAAVYRELLAEDGDVRTVLELGSGGGNNASHLKEHFAMTLVDLSPDMLALSRTLNPECEHICGDMRTIRLDRTFDAVFIHDAIMYMLDEADLLKAMETALVHCRPGGAVLMVPDFVRESFVEGTTTGGHERDGRSLRYLEWTWDPDPSDTTCEVAFTYMLREPDGRLRIESDHHRVGLFSRDRWLALLAQIGFEPRVILDEWNRESFVGQRPLP